MTYSTQLADRIRAFLAEIPNVEIEEKKMFSGLVFMVNGKMCINVSNDNIMCRFNPKLQEDIAEKPGFLPMMMKGKLLNGYCYITPERFQRKEDFE